MCVCCVCVCVRARACVRCILWSNSRTARLLQHYSKVQGFLYNASAGRSVACSKYGRTVWPQRRVLVGSCASTDTDMTPPARAHSPRRDPSIFVTFTPRAPALHRLRAAFPLAEKFVALNFCVRLVELGSH